MELKFYYTLLAIVCDNVSLNVEISQCHKLKYILLML